MKRLLGLLLVLAGSSPAQAEETFEDIERLIEVQIDCTGKSPEYLEASSSLYSFEGWVNVETVEPGLFRFWQPGPPAAGGTDFCLRYVGGDTNWLQAEGRAFVRLGVARFGDVKFKPRRGDWYPAPVVMILTDAPRPRLAVASLTSRTKKDNCDVTPLCCPDDPCGIGRRRSVLEFPRLHTVEGARLAARVPLLKMQLRSARNSVRVAWPCWEEFPVRIGWGNAVVQALVGKVTPFVVRRVPYTINLRHNGGRPAHATMESCGGHSALSVMSYIILATLKER